MGKNNPRGKLTSKVGKGWNDMTKKEQIAELKMRIKLQEKYIKANPYTVTDLAKKYLAGLKRQLKKLEG